MKKTLLLMLIVATVASCENVDPNKVNVTGTVVWIQSAGGGVLDGVVVQGALIAFYPAGSQLRDRIGEARTGSDGKFSFQIAPGSYDIVASKEGRASDVPPPGLSSKSKVSIPEGSIGADYDVGEFLYN